VVANAGPPGSYQGPRPPAEAAFDLVAGSFHHCSVWGYAEWSPPRRQFLYRGYLTATGAKLIDLVLRTRKVSSQYMGAKHRV